MLLNKERVLKSSHLCQAVFGSSKEEIEKLLPIFSQCLIAYRHQLKPKRKRRLGGGRKGDLPTDMDKLLYILMFLKIYPTYDVLSILSNHQRSKCGDSVNLLLPVLEMTLNRALVLPKRKARSLEEVFERCPELKDVFIDGTERKTQRPRNLKRRKNLYSGKKKSTTRKTIVLSDEKKKIFFMTTTKSWRRHDKKVFDKASLIENIPKRITIWTDTGFIGIQHLHPNCVFPDKTRKNFQLTNRPVAF